MLLQWVVCTASGSTKTDLRYMLNAIALGSLYIDRDALSFTQCNKKNMLENITRSLSLFHSLTQSDSSLASWYSHSTT